MRFFDWPASHTTNIMYWIYTVKDSNLSHENVVYIGDDYGLGGNDESVYTSDFNYLTIDDYRDFSKITKPLIDI